MQIFLSETPSYLHLFLHLEYPWTTQSCAVWISHRVNFTVFPINSQRENSDPTLKSNFIKGYLSAQTGLRRGDVFSPLEIGLILDVP